ncbi:peroxisomal nicotinamide adenine dinucleotide carrier [Chlorella sorokiniana]|uniref:Peroxisomal nicotinamide adenine dinucleotide carrier n=1 Tax=Chlorella sorokiniana TaxID=3076 RepID=A0A2P6TQA0_CHLSO|nr:peroxisomal nicotinamide adenine dinucleotide carrier [Chlorella sorokiniana]|eukprot:PRW56204.1 peroxisomal nicotinamide adenine dinucleotide carrier [Chlorella sorokiniana]
MTINTLQATRKTSEAAAEQQEQQDVEGVRQQQQRKPKRGGTLHEMAELVREGGWQALFSGIEASLIGTTVSQGIYFYLYSALRRLAVLRRAGAGADLRAANVTVAESLLVASLAGMGNVLLTNPIWMVATRMQALSCAKASAAARAAAAAKAAKAGGREGGEVEVEAPSQLGMVAVARQVYSEYGLAGFWNGTAASLVMVINPTLQYALYEWLQAARAKLRRSGSKGSPPARASAWEIFLLSSLAKLGATLVTYPMMNIKTRMYTASRSDSGAHHASILAAAASIMREEGPGGYYRGLRTKVVQSVLAAALLFVAKEEITNFTRDVLLAGGRSRPRKVVAA